MNNGHDDATVSPVEVVAEETDAAGLIEDDENKQRKGNTLTIWGNKQTMNLNHMVMENISQSPYYRNKLSELKTFHELVDEIYYNVSHLEPWEKGTRKTTGQTGMCGGVRGVGAGGVVSTPFCIMYKLFMIKLSRKQVYAMLNHTDSPFIRAVGFMYIRFCLEPSTFWDWYEPYLEDEESIDPKAGGGDPMTIGQMLKLFLNKLDWYCTLFPRIPVPVQKDIENKMREHNKKLYAERALEREDAEEDGKERIENNAQSKSRRSRSSERVDDKKRSERKRSKSPSSSHHSKKSRNSRSRSRSHGGRRKSSRSRSPTSRRHHKKSSKRRSPSPHRHRRSHSRSHGKRRDDDRSPRRR